MNGLGDRSRSNSNVAVVEREKEIVSLNVVNYLRSSACPGNRAYAVSKRLKRFILIRQCPVPR